MVFYEKRKATTFWNFCTTGSCEILKYSQVYELYWSIVWQEQGRTHKDFNECRKINQTLTKLILI